MLRVLQCVNVNFVVPILVRHKTEFCVGHPDIPKPLLKPINAAHLKAFKCYTKKEKNNFTITEIGKNCFF